MPGPRDSQTLQPYLPHLPVDDKVKCHKVIVTDVTDKAGWDVAPSCHFLAADHPIACVSGLASLQSMELRATWRKRWQKTSRSGSSTLPRNNTAGPATRQPNRPSLATTGRPTT